MPVIAERRHPFVSIQQRRERLARACLYLVCGPAFAPALPVVLAAGVDVVQLRDKHGSDADVLAAAEAFSRACARAGALFVLNDRPDLAAACEADGVHVGQDDASPARARALVGPDRLVGLSTHSPGQLAAASDVDYVAVGPVHETPTKPGRPATGIEYVRHAACHARLPWFAIGGIDESNVHEVIAAGARRIVVVRAIERASAPACAARALRSALDSGEEAGDGAP